MKVILPIYLLAFSLFGLSGDGVSDVVLCPGTKSGKLTATIQRTGSGTDCGKALTNVYGQLSSAALTQLNWSCDTCEIEGVPPLIKNCQAMTTFPDSEADVSCTECFPGPDPGTQIVTCTATVDAEFVLTCRDVCGG